MGLSLKRFYRSLALVLSIGLLPTTGVAQTEAKLRESIDSINRRYDSYSRLAEGVQELGNKAGQIGFVVASGFAYLRYSGMERGTQVAIAWGERLMVVGFLTGGLAFAAQVGVEILRPTPAHAATLAEPYKSEEGLARFFKLSREHQFEIANSDAEFAAMIERTAVALNELDKKQK